MTCRHRYISSAFGPEAALCLVVNGCGPVDPGLVRAHLDREKERLGCLPTFDEVEGCPAYHEGVAQYDDTPGPGEAPSPRVRISPERPHVEALAPTIHGGELIGAEVRIGNAGRPTAASIIPVGDFEIVLIHGASGTGIEDLARHVADLLPGARLLDCPECLTDLRALRERLAEEIGEASEGSPLVICTYSLFVIREVYLSGRRVRWIGLHLGPDGSMLAQVADDVSGTGHIMALDEEIAQSERYMDHEIGRNA